MNFEKKAESSFVVLLISAPQPVCREAILGMPRNNYILNHETKKKKKKKGKECIWVPDLFQNCTDLSQKIFLKFRLVA